MNHNCCINDAPQYMIARILLSAPVRLAGILVYGRNNKSLTISFFDMIISHDIALKFEMIDRLFVALRRLIFNFSNFSYL